MKAFIGKNVISTTLFLLSTSVVAAPAETDPPAIDKWSKWYDAYNVEGYEYRYAIVTPPEGAYFKPASVQPGIGGRYAPDIAYRPLMIRLTDNQLLLNTWSDRQIPDQLSMYQIDLSTGRKSPYKNSAGNTSNINFFPYFLFQNGSSSSYVIEGCQPIDEPLVFNNTCRFQAGTMRLTGLDFSIETGKQVPPKYALKSSTDVIAEGDHYAVVFEGGGDLDGSKLYQFFQNLVRKNGTDRSQWEVVEQLSSEPEPDFITDETYRHILIHKYCDLDIEDYDRACIDYPPLFTTDLDFVGFNARQKKYLVRYPDPDGAQDSYCMFPVDFNAGLVKKPDECVIKMPSLRVGYEKFKMAGISDDGNYAYVIQGETPQMYVAFKQPDKGWSDFQYLNQASVELIKNREVPNGYAFNIDSTLMNNDGDWMIVGSAQSPTSSESFNQIAPTLAESPLPVGDSKSDRKGLVVVFRKKESK